MKNSKNIMQTDVGPPDGCKYCLFLIRMQNALMEKDAEIRTLRTMLEEERARPDKMEDR